jgi:hypothetical protein
MTNTIKNTQIKILKINNKTYLPYQLHQLPKFFDKYTTDFFNLKGYCYINLNDHSDSFDLQNFKNRLTFNKDIHYSLKR